MHKKAWECVATLPVDDYEFSIYQDVESYFQDIQKDIDDMAHALETVSLYALESA